MKTFIYPEMMVHVAMCTHKDPHSVLLASDNADALEGELSRYRGVETASVAAGDLLNALRDVADKSIDVALIDTLSHDSAVLAHVNRVLKEDALCVLRHPDLDQQAENVKLMQILGNYFKIIMPYHVGDGTTLLLCSKEYHPTADLILQRSDLLEGHQYYNCDIHTAAFAMPQYVRKNYLGVIRN
ncbi:MAG: spermidine synthase [Campylobacterales bacterium]|nr:spermidine synthase [Campylobacterales bacterium]